MDFHNFQGDDKDKDAWIYSMQASMFELAKQQGGLEPVKWDQMGYAGKFVGWDTFGPIPHLGP